MSIVSRSEITEVRPIEQPAYNFITRDSRYC